MGKVSSKKRQRLIFYTTAVIFPVAQFIVFWVCVNFNSILLAFRTFDYQTGYDFAGFSNFKKVLDDIIHQPFMAAAFKNTLIVFAIGIVMMFSSIIISYYLYKKNFGSGFFKVILFLPSIVPSIVMILCFKYFVEIAVPEIWSKVYGESIQGLLSNPDTELATIFFRAAWFGIAGNFLLYTGAMTGISDSIIEAASLDGVTPVQEFVYIIFPMIFPTFSTFLITSFAVLFTNQMGLFDLYGVEANYSVYTVGYYLYKSIKLATVGDYPYLAAFGILLTLVAVPLCFLTKWLLNKLGPKSI